MALRQGLLSCAVLAASMRKSGAPRFLASTMRLPRRRETEAQGDIDGDDRPGRKWAGIPFCLIAIMLATPRARCQQ
jgi:hypothetical protein